MIYLDNQATTPVDKRVLSKMIPFFSENYGNPHSTEHGFGQYSNQAVNNARKQISSLIGSDKDEIIFTSGATESNNLAIKGSAIFRKKSKSHIITVSTEHKCVLESCRSLELEGFKVTILDVDRDGLININSLESAINNDTVLVSIMYANNETGVMQPIKKIGNICKKYNILFHTDAAQAYGKIPIDVNELNIDMMSISGHKIYGPKGIGALYIRGKPRVRLKAIIDGGGQERNFRSGTLPVPLCVGLGEAAKISLLEMHEEYDRIKILRDYFLNGLKNIFHNLIINGSMEQRLPNNLNLAIPGVESSDLINKLNEVCISSGSACTSSDLEPSYVLNAMKIEKDIVSSSFRIGLGRFTTKVEIDESIKEITQIANDILSCSKRSKNA